MTFSDIGSTASLLGLIVSVISLAVSIYVLIEVRNIRNAFRLRIRGASIIKELAKYSSNLSGCLDQFEDSLAQIDEELSRASAKLKYLKKTLTSSDTRTSVKRLLRSIKKCEITLENKDGVRQVYIEMNRVIEEVKDHQKDIRLGV